MHGMFRSNGGCGYVMKPHFLMNVDPNGEVFNPTAKLPVKKTLKVSAPSPNTILSSFPGMSQNLQCYLTGESVYGRWMAFGF